MVETDSAQADAGISVNVSESDLTTRLGDWLAQVLPCDPEHILVGQQNLIAPPLGPFATMTVVGRERLATNSSTYTATSRIIQYQSRVTVQVGLFGPGAGNDMQRVIGLFRDPFATEFFAAAGPAIHPLYASDARQTALIDESDQYADNWNADLVFQINYTMTVPQQTAASATVGIHEIDATYPPE